MTRFNDRMAQPGVLIADGATGTMLIAAGLPRGVAPERWNLENPEGVLALHRSYIEAGSDIILTNTFGGSSIRLQKDQLSEQARQINAAAAGLAREAAGEDVLVFGDIGPSGKLLKPYGPLTHEEAAASFAEQAAGLVECGVDAILIETMSDLAEVRAAVDGVRRSTDLPVLITMSFDTRGHTMMGVKPSQAMREIKKLGAYAVGANCGNTLIENLAAIEEMKAAEPDMILIAKPNAGLPRMAQVGDTKKLTYDVTPDVMGEYALKFRDLGVKIFGGCCGSTPEHIRAAADALK